MELKGSYSPFVMWMDAKSDIAISQHGDKIIWSLDGTLKKGEPAVLLGVQDGEVTKRTTLQWATYLTRLGHNFFARYTERGIQVTDFN